MNVLPSVDVPLLALRLGTYGLVRTAYLFVALVLMLRLSERQGVDRETVIGAFALGVPAGIVGARVLDILEYWGHHGGPRDVLGPTGSSIYGAFLFVLPVVWLYGRFRGVSPWRLLDAGAPVMALGETMTRVGCFLNGCCYGIPWKGPLSIVFPPESFAYRDQLTRGLIQPGALHSLPVVPVQLLSSGLALVAFVGLLGLFQRPHREGQVFFAFLAFYGALRLLVGPLRQEALQSMVVFSLGFMLAGGLGLIARRGTVARAPVVAARR